MKFAPFRLWAARDLSRMSIGKEDFHLLFTYLPHLLRIWILKAITPIQVAKKAKEARLRVKSFTIRIIVARKAVK